MQKLLFTRLRASIMDVKTAKVTFYTSINAAKRKSREIQMANGGMGRGSVRLA